MNRKLAYGAAVVLVVTIGALVVGSRLRPGPRPSMPARIGYLNITASLPLFIAEERGYFKDEGVDAKPLSMATSNQLVDAALAGNTDVIVETSAVPVLAAQLQAPGRLKVFALSTITEDKPFDAVLVPPNSPIQSLSDLVGKKIGVFPGTTATALLRHYLDSQGISTEGIQFSPLPPPSQLAALTSGSIDALHAYEPTIAIAEVEGKARAISGSVYAAMLSPNPQGVAIITAAFARSHPNEAAAVVRALERGMRDLVSDPDGSREVLVKRMQLDPVVAKRTEFLYMTPHQEADWNSFQEYADMLLQIGELDSTVSTDMLRFGN